MRRRSFLALGSAGLALAQGRGQRRVAPFDCGCGFAPQPGRGAGQASLAGFEPLQSGLKVTGMKVFGVSLTPASDRPYVFCKLETNQGLVGWGEGTLEGKAGATMACINDFREFVIGADPMQVEQIWQSMYVHSFYRAGPVMGSAISAIDQAPVLDARLGVQDNWNTDLFFLGRHNHRISARTVLRLSNQPRPLSPLARVSA